LYQQRIKKFIDEVTVYPVSCEKLANGRSDYEWLEGVLAGGARIVQLRDKEADDRAIYEKALMFRRKTREVGALLIINDRVDIAMLTDADGVHLGNNDLPPEEVKKMAPDLIIGVSCNTEEQVMALSGNMKSAAVSYFNIGPLFPTKTKKGLHAFLGLAAINRFSSMSVLPFTVMGGIKFGHIPELVALKARRIALVTALTQADDIAGETRRWVEAIKSLRGRQDLSS